MLDACKVAAAGVVRIAKHLRAKDMMISYNVVYRIMKENKMVAPSAAKSRRRRWIRYERKYSNAMWHTDWHEMKEPRFRGGCIRQLYTESNSRVLI